MDQCVKAVSYTHLDVYKRQGLSDEIAGLADTYVRIPMEGSVESLNAAVSAALLMYETNRQRRRNGK